MPISVDYDRKGNVVFSKAEGIIKRDDIISYFSSVASLGLRKGYCVLADYSKAQVDLSNDDIRMMAAQRKKMLSTSEKVKIAVCCTKDLVFGLGRMYEMVLGEDQYQVMVFRSREEAKNWIGI